MPNYPKLPVEDPMGDIQGDVTDSVNPSEPQMPTHTQPVPGNWHDPMCQCFGCKACKPK